MTTLQFPTPLPGCAVCGAQAALSDHGRIVITHDPARHGIVPPPSPHTATPYAPPVRRPVSAAAFGYDPEAEA